MYKTTPEKAVDLDKQELHEHRKRANKRVRAGKNHNNPILIEYAEKLGNSYWGFERVEPALSDIWHPDKVKFTFVDHSRGVNQTEKPSPLPPQIKLIDQTNVPWPMYLVNIEKIGARWVGYPGPTETALRIETGEMLAMLVGYTFPRHLSKEWEVRRNWDDLTEILGKVSYMNSNCRWCQYQDPRIIEDTLVAGRPAMEFRARTFAFRQACAINALNIRDFIQPGQVIDPDLSMVENRKKFYSIFVSDEAFFSESFEQVMNKLMGFQLRRMLMVKFIGQPAQDDGGPFREWISRITKEFMDFKAGNYKLFDMDPVFGCIVSKFAVGIKELLPFFRFFGRFIGICLVHGVHLGTLSPILLKQMKGDKITARDLSLDFLFIAGLRGVLNCQTNDELNDAFAINAESVGGNVIFNLIPDGHNKMVTLANRDEYLKARIMFKTGATQEIIDTIRFGIDEVMPVSWLGVFTVKELGLMLGGIKPRISVIDWIDRCAITEETKFEDYKVIGWFWQIVRMFSVEAQYKLFQFWTAADALPMEGISGVEPFLIHIQEDRESVIGLPFASTCYHRITIPAYASKQILFDRLAKAIYGFQGFSKA